MNLGRASTHCLITQRVARKLWKNLILSTASSFMKVRTYANLNVKEKRQKRNETNIIRLKVLASLFLESKQLSRRIDLNMKLAQFFVSHLIACHS